MNKWHNKAFCSCATLGTIGFLPGSGTWASLSSVPLALYIRSLCSAHMYIVFCLLFTLLSLLIITKALPFFRSKDPREIVLDECVGTFFLVCDMPVSFLGACGILVMFRLFDIFKPFLVGMAEKVRGAYGIILDDIVASILALVCVKLFFISLQYVV